MSRGKPIHAVFHCTAPACAFEADDYKTAQRKAAAHAKATGHTVKGEVAYPFWYHGEVKK